MRRLLDEYDDRMMVGEIYLPNKELVTYYGTRWGRMPSALQLPVDRRSLERPGRARWWTPTKRAARLPAGPTGCWATTTGTGSPPGSARTRRASPTCSSYPARDAHLLLRRRAGMENVPIPLERVQDPPALNQPAIADVVGRDPVRTPMQWDDGPNAGFAPAGVRPGSPLRLTTRSGMWPWRSRNPLPCSAISAP